MSKQRKASLDQDGLRAALAEACAEAGGQSHWAVSNNLSAQYVSDVLKNRRQPGEAIIRALGYQKHVEYVRQDIWDRKASYEQKITHKDQD